MDDTPLSPSIVPADLLESSELSAEEKREVQRIGGADDTIVLPEVVTKEVEGGTVAGSESPEAALTDPGKSDQQDIRALLSKMTMPQRLKTGMFGNSVCRALLIRDSSKLIQAAVLKNPKLGAAEVEEFAKNPNLSQYVLRSISENQTWMRSYSIKVSIVMNPKTPQDLALKWIRFLNIGDLRKIARSKNLPQVVAITARKRVADAE